MINVDTVKSSDYSEGFEFDRHLFVDNIDDILRYVLVFASNGEVVDLSDEINFISFVVGMIV